MKPTFQFTQTTSRLEAATTRRSGRFPKTDYCFRPPTLDFDSRCRGEGDPSFRRISKAYFDNEAGKHFATEAAFFVLIVLTAAWPVAKAIAGLFQLFSTTGVL